MKNKLIYNGLKSNQKTFELITLIENDIITLYDLKKYFKKSFDNLNFLNNI